MVENSKQPNSNLPVSTKNRRGQKFFLLVIILAATAMMISLIYLTFWLIDNYNTAENTTSVVENANLTTISNENDSEPGDDSSSEFNPYWDFGDTDYLAADFDQLKQINPEIVAWISVGGTNINYPITQHSDNSFYLNHSVDRSKNDAGWVFMDYRNQSFKAQTSNHYDRNTIIYAHGRHDGSMFGSLKRILGKEWHNNPDNFLVKISTPHSNSIWQIFSTYQVPDTNDYIQTDFENDTEFSDFLQLLQNRSKFQYHVDLKPTDHILTLSTCANTNSGDKIVAHAKLIRSQNR